MRKDKIDTSDLGILIFPNLLNFIFIFFTLRLHVLSDIFKNEKIWNQKDFNTEQVPIGDLLYFLYIF